MPEQRVLSLSKGSERWVFACPLGAEPQLIRALWALVEDPHSAFDAFDAAVLSYQMGVDACDAPPAAKVVCTSAMANVSCDPQDQSHAIPRPGANACR